MVDEENIKTIYIYEQNLLKSCTNKLIESSNEIIHDNILSIFDNIDEINIKLHKFLTIGKPEEVDKIKKEKLFEELDNLYIGINK